MSDLIAWFLEIASAIETFFLMMLQTQAADVCPYSVQLTVPAEQTWKPQGDEITYCCSEPEPELMLVFQTSAQ